MTTSEQILRETQSVLLVDWPSTDVPKTLAQAGYAVAVKGGPGPDSYSAWQLNDGEVARRDLDQAPEHVDLVYAHRPIDELPTIVAMARTLGARAVWRQSGLDRAGNNDPAGCWLPVEDSQEGHRLAQAAGLHYVDDIYIADAVRALRATT